MNAVDTNILIYPWDDADPDKRDRAKQFLEELTQSIAPTILVWQVAVEYAATLHRFSGTGKIEFDNVETIVTELLSTYPLIAPNRRVFERSFGLQKRYSLSYWDGLLIAACLEAGVTTLYSEDMTHEGTFESLTVMNPLRQN
jgi:predicted nucleic acid-binding protein